MDRKRDKLTILFPYQERVAYRSMPDETLHDLGMDSLCREVTADPKEQAMILQVSLKYLILVQNLLIKSLI